MHRLFRLFLLFAEAFLEDDLAVAADLVAAVAAVIEAVAVNCRMEAAPIGAHELVGFVAGRVEREDGIDDGET